MENNSLNDIIYSGIEIEVRKFNEIDRRKSTKWKTAFSFQILRAIAKTMNFSTNLYETEDAAREKWGSVSPNGSYTGILGEMVRQQEK